MLTNPTDITVDERAVCGFSKACLLDNLPLQQIADLLEFLATLK